MFLINLQPQFLSSQPIHPVEKTATRKLNKIFLDFFFSSYLYKYIITLAFKFLQEIQCILE